MTTQPSLPPPPQQQPNGGVQVRCAGCRTILTVGPGVTEFICPTCQLPQMLPPELMSMGRGGAAAVNANVKAPSHVPAHGIDPTKIQLPCANCKAILNVPHGLVRFSCPQCAVELAVDLSKVKQFFPPPPRPPLPPPPDDVNEIFGGMWYFLVICKKMTSPSQNLQQLGTFKDAFESRIVEDKNLGKRVYQCFIWGLLNVSSATVFLGAFSRNHTTINNGDDWESALVIAMLIYWVITFALFIRSLLVVFVQ